MLVTALDLYINQIAAPTTSVQLCPNSKVIHDGSIKTRFLSDTIALLLFSDTAAQHTILAAHYAHSRNEVSPLPRKLFKFLMLTRYPRPCSIPISRCAYMILTVFSQDSWYGHFIAACICCIKARYVKCRRVLYGRWRCRVCIIIILSTIYTYKKHFEFYSLTYHSISHKAMPRVYFRVSFIVSRYSLLF